MEVKTLGHLGLGDVKNFDEMLSAHPAYRDAFFNLHESLMRDNGPLEHHYRHYIAILASSRHQCSYLVDDQRAHFLDFGGPQEWLDGLQFAPRKLQILQNTNKILAHRPWLYNKTHIESLLKNGWSLGELTHAVCILVHFHSLCSIIHGSGMEAVLGEPPVQQSEFQGLANESPGAKELSEGGLEVLLNRMKSISLSETEAPVDEQIESFEKLKNQTADITSPDLKVVSTPSVMKFSNLSPDLDYSYIDFANETDSVLGMKSRDFTWEDEGFSILSDRLYMDMGDPFDEKFKTAYSMTYYTCGTADHVDTGPFRRGLWNYLHCLYGIRHDYYNYSEVNRLVEPNLKAFLKTVSCYPERLCAKAHDPPLMKDFLASERLHVVILVVEARLQAELLYALRAIGRYLVTS